MKKNISILIFSMLFSFMAFGQGKNAPNRKLKVGEHISEDFKVKSGRSEIFYQRHFVESSNFWYDKKHLYEKDYTILYRFNNEAGQIDNSDSVCQIISCMMSLNSKKSNSLNVEEYYNSYINIFDIGDKSTNWVFNDSCFDKYGLDIDKCRRIKYEFSKSKIQLYNRIYKLKEKISDPHSFINSGKLILTDYNGKVLVISNSIAEFVKKIDRGNFDIKRSKKIKGKLLTQNKDNKMPLNEAVVAIVNQSTLTDTLSKTHTNQYGDFELRSPEEKSYKLSVIPKDKSIDNIILATQTGKQIALLQKGANGFEYKLIAGDIIKLSHEEESEDISKAFKSFNIGANKEIKITENISYASGKYELEQSSTSVLDKVVTILQGNPKIKLDVISHTDAIGDDNENMELSIKRSNAVIEFLVKKGIDKTRLNAVGKGETEIRNRCSNSVDCSDIEHGYNRRTEFHFMK